MASLAEAADLAVRLGVTFTETESAQATAVLESATDLILDVVGKDTTWLDAQQDAATVPPRLRVTCLELGVRVLANPRGARSTSRTLGAYSSSESFAETSAGMELTEREERQCRRAVHGTLAGSAHAHTLLDHLVRDEDLGGVDLLELDEAHGS